MSSRKSVPPQTSVTHSSPAASTARPAIVTIVALMLAVLVAGIYSAASYRNGFIYDDKTVILRQDPVHSATQVAKLFVTRHFPNDYPYYRPTAVASLLVQRAIHGDDPGPYHLFNAACAGLIFLAAYAMLRQKAFQLPAIVSLFAALLFVAHPAMSSIVYPAASGRESLLPVLFIVLTVTTYLRSGWMWFALSMLCLVAALASKELAVVVPGVLVLAELLRLPDEKRSRAEQVVRVVVMIAILAGYFALRRSIFVDAAVTNLALHEDPLGPAKSFWFAFQSVFAPPVKLVYEPPAEVWFSVPRLAVTLIAMTLLGVLAARSWRQTWRVVLFWLGFFALTQLPTAQIFTQRPQYDERYAVTAVLAIVAIAATTLPQVWRSSRSRLITLAITLLLVVGWFSISIARSASFRSESGFIEHWLTTNPNSAVAHYNYSFAVANRGDVPGAIKHLIRAIELENNYVDALNQLGHRYVSINEPANAVQCYEQVLRLKKDSEEAVNGMGTALASMGRIEEATTYFQRSAKLKPTLAEPRANLAMAYHLLGRHSSAVEQFIQALRMQADAAQVYPYLNLAVNQRAKANQVLQQFATQASQQPDAVEPLVWQAWILATHPDMTVRDGQRAVQLAMRACELTQHRQAYTLDALAAACAESGRFDLAIQYAQRAGQLAETALQPLLHRQIQYRLAHYQQRQAFRMPVVNAGAGADGAR